MTDYNKLSKAVDESQAFVLSDGSNIKTLSELVTALKNMDDSVFTSYVNEEKNDFSNWINHCFEDELLAQRVSKLSSKEECASEIETRLEQSKISQDGIPQEETAQTEPEKHEVEQEQETTEELPPPKQTRPVDQPEQATQSSETDSIDKPIPAKEVVTNQPVEVVDKTEVEELDDDLDIDLDLDEDEQQIDIPQTDMPQTAPVVDTVPPTTPLQQTQPQITAEEPQIQADAEVDDSIDDLDSELDDTEINDVETQSSETASVDKLEPEEEVQVAKSPVIPPQERPEPKEPEPIPKQPEPQIIEQEVNSPGEDELEHVQKEKPQPTVQETQQEAPQEEQVQEKPVEKVQPATPEETKEQRDEAKPISREIIPEEQKLLDTKNQDLSGAEIFKKIKLQKELGIDTGVTQSSETDSEDKLDSTIFSEDGLPDNLNEDKKRLLTTENKELNQLELFKKFRLIKELELNEKLEKPPEIGEEAKISVEEKQEKKEEDILKPVDILNISDEEFNTLIDVNPSDEHVAVISTEHIIKVKKRKHLKTGVPGFDELLTKGIPEGSSVLISGGPGSGKTTFCIQQLGWAAERGEKCLFISLEEKEERLIEHMKGFGLNPEKYIKNETLKIKKLDSFKLSRSVEALLAHARGELMIDVAPVLDIIPENYKPNRVVLDSLSSISAAFAGKPEEYRVYVEQLFNIFNMLGVTSFIITEIQGVETRGHGGIEEFLADGVINFYNIKKGALRQPALEILKMRGVNHKRKIVPFNYAPGLGIEIYPLEEVFHGDE